MKITEDKSSFEEFMGAYGVTFEEHRDLFDMPKEYSLTYYVAADLNFFFFSTNVLGNIKN